MPNDHSQQRFNIKQVQAAWNNFSDLYDRKHPAVSAKITDYAGTIGTKRGY